MTKIPATIERYNGFNLLKCADTGEIITHYSNPILENSIRKIFEILSEEENTKRKQEKVLDNNL